MPFSLFVPGEPGCKIPVRPGRFIKNSLGTADAPCQADQIRYVNPKGTITPGAQHTSFPQNFPHGYKFLPGDMAFLFINDPQGLDEFMGRHVFGLLLPTAVKKTAVRTETTMGAHFQ